MAKKRTITIEIEGPLDAKTTPIAHALWSVAYAALSDRDFTLSMRRGQQRGTRRSLGRGESFGLAEAELIAN